MYLWGLHTTDHLHKGRSTMVSMFPISLENVWFTTTFILSRQQSYIPCIFPLAFPSTSLLTCYSKINKQRMKTTTCRVGTLKNQQKRWEHHNTFTSSLCLVPFCQLCRPKTLYMNITIHAHHNYTLRHSSLLSPQSSVYNPDNLYLPCLPCSVAIKSCSHL